MFVSQSAHLSTKNERSMKSHPDFPNLFVVDHPLVAHKLSHMRDQDSSTRTFRSLLRELTLLMGYELTRDFKLTRLLIVRALFFFFV